MTKKQKYTYTFHQMIPIINLKPKNNKDLCYNKSCYIRRNYSYIPNRRLSGKNKWMLPFTSLSKSFWWMFSRQKITWISLMNMKHLRKHLISKTSGKHECSDLQAGSFQSQTSSLQDYKKCPGSKLCEPYILIRFFQQVNLC